MTWERGLLDLFDDLETQAAGLAHDARDTDVADLARAEYAGVTLLQRLHGAVGSRVSVRAVGGVVVRGRLERVGRGVLVVLGEASDGLQLVNARHVVDVETVTSRATTEEQLDVTARLGLASAVRHLADEVDLLTVHLCDGRRLDGRLSRVGADFVELVAGAHEDGAGPATVPAPSTVVPLRAVVVLAGR